MAEQVTIIRVTGTILSVKGKCTVGHKVGDKFELSVYSSGGLCGFFYNSIYPTIQMLEYGGTEPWCEADPDVTTKICPDKINIVLIELRREKATIDRAALLEGNKVVR